MSSLRVAVLHNLPAGGARRRLAGTLAHLHNPVREFVLSTALPITDDSVVVDYRSWADAAPSTARPPLRYLDHARLLLAWRRLGREIERWRPDIIFANPCRFLQGPAALLVGKCPVLYYCDEARRATFDRDALSHVNPRTERLYRPLRAHRAEVDRRVVARADRVVTNSPFSADGIRAAYEVACDVIGLGADDAFYASATPRHPQHVLSVGTLIPTKGHDLAIDAVALSGVELPLQIVAPRPDDEEVRRLKSRAAARGVDLRIRVGVSDDELRECYWDALATLYLSVAEPFGLVSVESQAAGTPVIVADEGGLPSTLLSTTSGVVVPRCGEAAGRALAELAARAPSGGSVVDAADVPRWSDTAAAVLRDMEELCRR